MNGLLTQGCEGICEHQRMPSLLYSMVHARMVPNPGSPRTLTLLTQAMRSPQDKALQASAHLRTPPTSAKKALRFSPTRIPALSRPGQAQQAAAAAAQATSKVISGFGHVAARLGISGFFGGAPAGNKPGRLHKRHTAAAASAAVRAALYIITTHAWKAFQSVYSSLMQ